MHLETCEKKWLDEEIMKLPQVDMSEGIDQETLDKFCSRLILALKFKSEKWGVFQNDTSKKSCNKYKKFEEYVYVRLDRKATEENQVQQSTQPTIEQSQVDEEASADIPDSQ